MSTHFARPPRTASPVPLPGFEQLQRFWDPDTSHWTVKLLPGEYYVTPHDEAITTVLGSCVTACIRDAQARVGGMNHFMLPEESGLRDHQTPNPMERQETRYGCYAMECLINDLLKLGAARERLEIKVFGGARILASITDIGMRNIEFMRDYLHLEGLAAIAQDLGGDRPRRLVYFPTTGRVRMKRLRPIENRTIADREQLYLASLRRDQDGGDIEIFR
jgi:chemotaxis protein CheD